MKLPLPTNRLVTLTLAGAFVALAASVALATPGLLPRPSGGLPADAPYEDPNFTPAVLERSAQGSEHGEWEEHEREEHGERGEYEREEHEEEDDD